MWRNGHFVQVVSREEARYGRENKVSHTRWGGYRLHTSTRPKGVEFTTVTDRKGLCYWKASLKNGKYGVGATPQEAAAMLGTCRNHRS